MGKGGRKRERREDGLAWTGNREGRLLVNQMYVPPPDQMLALVTPLLPSPLHTLITRPGHLTDSLTCPRPSPFSL